MKINFTGIKNPGYYSSKIYTTTQYDENNVEYSEDNYIDVKYVNMELTDDFNGKDLSEYKKLLKKSNVEYLKHPINPNFLNIGVLKGELPADKETYLFVNGTLLEVEDKKLPIISFMMKKLIQLKDNINIAHIDKDFYKSDIASNTLMLGRDIRDDYHYYEDPLPDLKKYYTPKYISHTAKNMFDLLDKKMLEYFNL